MLLAAGWLAGATEMLLKVLRLSPKPLGFIFAEMLQILAGWGGQVLQIFLQMGISIANAFSG